MNGHEAYNSHHMNSVTHAHGKRLLKVHYQSNE
uniref:Uncharacterized protein n=1 Tax=Anguilla anguilla TaxID=7936 RepID=A0A0E9TEU4_ANGAN